MTAPTRRTDHTDHTDPTRTTRRGRHPHHPRRHALLALAALTLATGAAACGSDDTGESTDSTSASTTIESTIESTSPSTTDSIEPADGFDPATAVVVYSFNDSSVPPEYHRSYTVTVRQGEANVVVDSYGDVLHDVTEPIDDDLWQRTLDTAAGFADAASSPESGCTGGTSEQLAVFADGVSDTAAPAIDVWVDSCDDGPTPNIVTAVGEILPLFDMDTLTATD